MHVDNPSVSEYLPASHAVQLFLPTRNNVYQLIPSPPPYKTTRVVTFAVLILALAAFEAFRLAGFVQKRANPTLCAAGSPRSRRVFSFSTLLARLLARIVLVFACEALLAFRNARVFIKRAHEAILTLRLPFGASKRAVRAWIARYFT